MVVNPRKYAGFHRGIGDESNSPVLEILVPGELTETYPRAIHIAQAGDADSDWNVAANAHPVLNIHSVTTPTTDFLSIGGHDGTTATIDVVGGTTLAFSIASTNELNITADGLLGANAAGPAFLNEAATTTNPTLIPDRAEFDTGWGWASNTLHAVLGGASHLTIAQNAITHSTANSGAISTLTITNTSDDSSAGARVGATAGGSSASGDAMFTATETSGSILSVGVDVSASFGVIAMDVTFGTNDTDVIRISGTAPPVITYNGTNPSGTFDYVCEACGEHGGAMFECDCGGTVSWHDDMAALLPVLADMDAFDIQSPAMRHLADIGVVDLSVDHKGQPGLFIQMANAQWYTWSAMTQMYRHNEDLESRIVELEKIAA